MESQSGALESLKVRRELVEQAAVGVSRFEVDNILQNLADKMYGYETSVEPFPFLKPAILGASVGAVASGVFAGYAFMRACKGSSRKGKVLWGLAGIAATAAAIYCASEAVKESYSAFEFRRRNFHLALHGDPTLTSSTTEEKCTDTPSQSLDEIMGIKNTSEEERLSFIKQTRSCSKIVTVYAKYCNAFHCENRLVANYERQSDEITNRRRTAEGEPRLKWGLFGPRSVQQYKISEMVHFTTRTNCPISGTETTSDKRCRTDSRRDSPGSVSDEQVVTALSPAQLFFMAIYQTVFRQG